MKNIVFALFFLLSACNQKIVTVDAAFKAVDENNSSVLKAYLEQGGDPNSVDGKNRSLLYIATGPHGGYEVLSVLLEAGADPNNGSGGYTPLMNASSWCWLKGVKLLIEKGANTMLKNSKGKTAVETVCSAGSGREKVIEYLKTKMTYNQAFHLTAYRGASLAAGAK